MDGMEGKLVRSRTSRAALIRVLALAVLLATALGGALAPRYEAEADDSWPNVSVCFKYSDGHYYANRPVSLWVRNHGTAEWSVMKSGYTNANGCATFVDVVPNEQYQFTAYFRAFFGNEGCYWRHKSESSEFPVYWSSFSFPQRLLVTTTKICP